MDFQNMVESEDSDSLYYRWSDYRRELTHYIIGSVEELYIKKKLFDLRKRRILGTYNIENIVVELGHKPTLAIWGAGGCNDIDIVMLSKYFKLILIDNNVEKTEKARERFGLSREDCICVDLHFWDIKADDYKMFDALLNDGADADEIMGFINELENGNIKPDYSEMPKFDYSVAVGLASQLNSRFAAILHMYNVRRANKEYGIKIRKYTADEVEHIYSIIRRLNNVAVEHMLEAINAMTDKGVILGYEADNFDGCYDLNMALQLKCLNEEHEVLITSGISAFNRWKDKIMISGNQELEDGIRWRVEGLGEFTVTNYKSMIWPFLDSKNYLMVIRTLEKCG